MKNKDFLFYSLDSISRLLFKSCFTKNISMKPIASPASIKIQLFCAPACVAFAPLEIQVRSYPMQPENILAPEYKQPTAKDSLTG